MSSRGFGDVYRALYKKSNVYVAVKKARLAVHDENVVRESELLMKCNSPFIVRYIGVTTYENDLWVMKSRKE